ncbi:MAG TPA: glycosyltransferase family 4 protein [Candidatus Latescibacteria bacterium]|nr:glycosyltransferase family 4 protein [Candidatus Latescibacterota bacterium]
MHIAFFNRSYYPDTTATGQLLTELCEDLARDHGCRVTVVAGVPSPPWANPTTASTRRGIVEQEEHNGVAILRARGTCFSRARFMGRAANYATYFLSACLAGLRLERPDVLVALTDPPIIGLAALLAARRFRGSFVMSFQDIFPEVARLLEDFQSEAVNRALHRVTCFLARKADINIALGETMRYRLITGKGVDPERTVIIPNWADCRAIAPTEKDNPFSRHAGLSGHFVVMHSGNIGLSQGLEHLIRAAAILRVFPDIRIVFVGDGVKKTAHVRQAEELQLPNVTFLPFTPKARLCESFGAADVFVVSLKKGLAGYIVPSKVYGILAAGRPYVAAVDAQSEVAEISRKYDCGIVVPPEDCEALAEGILRVYRDKELARKLGENARRAALDFDRPVHVRAYFRLFEQLVEQGRPVSVAR